MSGSEPPIDFAAKQTFVDNQSWEPSDSYQAFPVVS